MRKHKLLQIGVNSDPVIKIRITSQQTRSPINQESIKEKIQ